MHLLVVMSYCFSSFDASCINTSHIEQGPLTTLQATFFKHKGVSEAQHLIPLSLHYRRLCCAPAPTCNISNDPEEISANDESCRPARVFHSAAVTLDIASTYLTRHIPSFHRYQKKPLARGCDHCSSLLALLLHPSLVTGSSVMVIYLARAYLV